MVLQPVPWFLASPKVLVKRDHTSPFDHIVKKMAAVLPPPRKRTHPTKVPTSNKKAKKEQVTVVQEGISNMAEANLDQELDHLLSSMRHTSKLFRQAPSEAPCPLHPTLMLNKRTSKKGWEYVKCTEENCPVFLPWDDLMVFTLAQLCNVHPTLANGLLCECNKPTKVVLTRKEESKNQGRCFFTCAHKSYTKKGCETFQWIDEAL